jgi:hypothetical protein
MVHISLTQSYSLPGPPLSIDADLAGWEHTTDITKFNVTVLVPEAEQQGERKERRRRMDVSSLTARVVFEVPLDVASAIDSPDDRQLSLILAEAQQAGAAAIGRVLRGARLNQPWLGLANVLPDPVGPPLVVNIDESLTLRVAPMPLARLGWFWDYPPPALSKAEFVRYLEGEPMPVPESLFADAFYFARHHTPPDPARGVLIGAIACELKAKTALRRLAKPDQVSLLDEVLNRPRPATSLFHSIPKAVTGRSLHDDDVKAYAGVALLFRIRNAIAHSGQRPTNDELRSCLEAVAAAFRWYDDAVERAGRENHGVG